MVLVWEKIMINDIILFDGSLQCQTRLEYEIDEVVKEFPYWNEIKDIFKIQNSVSLNFYPFFHFENSN